MSADTKKSGKKAEPKKDDAGPSVPINEKIDELVAKIVPAKWLATSLTSAAALLLLFFFMWAFSGNALPDEQKKIVDEAITSATEDIKLAEERAKKRVDAVEKKTKETVAKIKEENAKLRESTRTAQSAAKNYERTKKDLDTYKAKYEDASKKLSDAKDKLNKNIRASRTAEGKLQSEKRILTKELASAKSTLEKTQKEYTAYKTKYSSQAKAAFEQIIETASRQTANSQQLLVLNKMAASAEFAKELAGTDYSTRLERHIKKVEALAARDNKVAAKKSAQEARARYNKAKADMRNASDDDARLEILREAKIELEGSAYHAHIQKEIDAIEGKRRLVAAKAAFEEVTKKVAKAPTEFESNLQTLKDARPDVAKTAYELKLEKLIRSREASLKNDIAKLTYNQLNQFIRGTTRTEDGYRSVLARCGEVAPKIEGTAYNKHLDKIRSKYTTLLGNGIATGAIAQIDALARKIEKNKAGYKSVVDLCDELTSKVEDTPYLKTLQAKRKQYSEYWVNAIGAEALVKAKKIVKNRNMAASDKVSALEELRREAEGSSAARSIDAYIKTAKAQAAREAK